MIKINPKFLYNNFNNFLTVPEDIVWNIITDSAKTRFNFPEFVKEFSTFDDEQVADNILFRIIVGHVAGDSTETIAAKVNQDIMMIGFAFDDAFLNRFITERRSDLFREIKATDIAAQSFEAGFKIPGILVNVRSILKDSDER